MEKLKITPITHRLFDFALDIAEPVHPGERGARIGMVAIIADAEMIKQAVNSYTPHVALLEQAQLVLANMREKSHRADYITLCEQIDAALVAHHSYLESLL